MDASDALCFDRNMREMGALRGRDGVKELDKMLVDLTVMFA